MTRSMTSDLPGNDLKEIFADLSYLNLAEIKTFCKRHSIPYRIAIETPDAGKKTTKEDDRKGVILRRIQHFLRTGVILEQTCFKAKVVCFDPLPKRLTANDRLFYGQYDKSNPAMISLLKSLTDGKFENGAIARILARDFWSQGKAPTFREYASAWLQAVKDHKKPNPEWAFLSDRANKKEIADWKSLRRSKASRVMKVLDQIPLPEFRSGR
jgi:hypothetical protein